MLKVIKTKCFIPLTRGERGAEMERKGGTETEIKIKRTGGKGKRENFKHFFNITDSQYQIRFFAH